MRKWRHKRGFPKKYLLLLIPFILSLCLVIFLSKGLQDRIKMVVTAPIKPMQKAFLETGRGTKAGLKRLAYMWKAAGEAEKLRKELYELENKFLVREAHIERLETELSAIANFHKETDLAEKPILAHVIGYDTSEFRKSIFIDAGSRHGITPDSLVVTEEALVGKVSAVGSVSSRVQLITDPASKIPVKVLETEEVGVLEGTSSNYCQLKYLPRWTRVVKGHKIVSSSIGGLYPEAVFVAIVSEDDDTEVAPYRTVKALPRADFARLDTVLVLKSANTP